MAGRGTRTNGLWFIVQRCEKGVLDAFQNLVVIVTEQPWRKNAGLICPARGEYELEKRVGLVTAHAGKVAS